MSACASKKSTSSIDPIFESICRGELAHRLYSGDPKFSAAAIAAWQADPVNQRRMELFRAAFEMQGQLMAAKARTDAVANLLRIIHDPESGPETVRKACCEILKMSAKLPSRDDRKSGSAMNVEPSEENQAQQGENLANALKARPKANPEPVVRLSGNGTHARQPLSSAIDAVPTRLADLEDAHAIMEFEQFTPGSKAISSNGRHH